VLISSSSCGFIDNHYELDLSSDKSFSLFSSNEELPSSFRLSAKGNYTGEGTLVLLLDGSEYKTKTIKGNTKFSWSGDWYYPEMKFEYRVTKKGIGNLKLKYKIGHGV